MVSTQRFVLDGRMGTAPSGGHLMGFRLAAARPAIAAAGHAPSHIHVVGAPLESIHVNLRHSKGKNHHA
jgi:hypothetical protein